MTETSLSPLDLPETDWEAWVADRTESQLARATELVEAAKQGPRDASALSTWNDINIALGNAFAVASLMSNVHPDEAVRNRAEAAEQAASRLLTEIGLDRDLFEVLDAVHPSELDDAGRRVLSLTLRDFRRAGVDQDDDVRDRLRKLNERETEVGQTFAKNIRDSVRTIRIEPERLDGLPADYIEAHPPGEDGLVTITTEYPDYVPFMTFAKDREARAALLHEFRNRAWPENDAVLAELLKLRDEHAKLLGYADWPSYDAEVKMIGKGDAIPEFIDRISDAAEEPGKRDIAVLLARLQQDHPEVETIDGRDGSFYAEVIRRENFDVDAQQVRTYFDFQKVRAGLLDVTGRLFGIEYVPVDVPVWHEDVASYDVMRDGERLGRIHLDLHPRAGKYGHAAQFDLVPGIRGRQLPQGVLVCNFSKQLMEHDHVVTLFHEFGHLVHHVLAGRHDWARFSGVATEWDFVEAPSQMLEEWAWDAGVLASFATDDDGKPIPADLVSTMSAANELGRGFDVRVQVFYAAISVGIHADVPDDLTAYIDDLAKRYMPFERIPGTHKHTSFGHLADEGYGSSYYTYLWSLVIAKDLFSAFDPDDLMAPDVARRYRDTVLAAGGSRDAADLVGSFLGRPTSADTFDRWLAG